MTEKQSRDSDSQRRRTFTQVKRRWITLAGTFHQTSVTRKCIKNIDSLYVTIELQEKYSHQISVRGKRRSSREISSKLTGKVGGYFSLKLTGKLGRVIKTRWQKKPEGRDYHWDASAPSLVSSVVGVSLLQRGEVPAIRWVGSWPGPRALLCL